MRRRIGNGLLLATATMILITASVSAKLDATLSRAQAQPGDMVTLTTAGQRPAGKAYEPRIGLGSWADVPIATTISSCASSTIDRGSPVTSWPFR